MASATKKVNSTSSDTSGNVTPGLFRVDRASADQEVLNDDDAIVAIGGKRRSARERNSAEVLHDNFVDSKSPKRDVNESLERALKIAQLVKQ